MGSHDVMRRIAVGAVRDYSGRVRFLNCRFFSSASPPVSSGVLFPALGFLPPDRVNPGERKPWRERRKEKLTSWTISFFFPLHHWDEDRLSDITRGPEGVDEIQREMIAFAAAWLEDLEKSSTNPTVFRGPAPHN